MPARVWDPFLTASDKAHLAASRPNAPYGFGERAAVLSVDNYRGAVGDEPQPLLEAIRTWPSSTGLAAWQALDRIAVVFAAARAGGVPVIHVTGLDVAESGMAGWRHPRGQLGGDGAVRDAAAQDRHRRRYDIVEQAAPLPGEVVLKKTAPSAFFGTPLAAHLMGAGIDTLIVVGEAVSGCVRATVVDGCSYRLRMIVVEDCVYDRHEATRAMNLFDIDQKYGDVVASQAVLDWFASSGNPPTERSHAHSHSHVSHGAAEVHELPVPQVLRAALPAGAELVAVGHHPINGHTIERAGSDVIDAARQEMSGGFGAVAHLVVALNRDDVADEPELARALDRTEGGVLLVGVGYRVPSNRPAPTAMPGPAGAADEACPECGSRSAQRDTAPESPGAPIYVCADCGAAWDV